MRFRLTPRDTSFYDQFAAEVEGGAELIEKALALADGC